MTQVAPRFYTLGTCFGGKAFSVRSVWGPVQRLALIPSFKATISFIVHGVGVSSDSSSGVGDITLTSKMEI